jgi:hypothetical protein
MIFVGKLKERVHKEDYDVDEIRVRIKIDFRVIGYGVWMGFIWLNAGFLCTR